MTARDAMLTSIACADFADQLRREAKKRHSQRPDRAEVRATLRKRAMMFDAASVKFSRHAPGSSMPS